MSVAEAPLLVAVMGPTGSGKTALAELIADRLGAQLVNADAFQIYRGMDIGTAKPVERHRYLLLDLKDPHEPFGAGEWLRLASEALVELWSQRRPAVIVGGTLYYVRALFERYTAMQGPPDPELRRALVEREAHEGLAALFAELLRVDPDAAAKVDAQNPARVRRALERAHSPVERVHVTLPPFRPAKIGLDWTVAELDARIAMRTRQMLDQGWLAEVRSLLKGGVRPTDPGMRAIGYIPLALYLEGSRSFEDAVMRIQIDTRRYAKRQRTWMRSEPHLFRLHRQFGEEIKDSELLGLLAQARRVGYGEDD